MKYQIPNKIIIWGNDNSNMLGLLRQLSENKLFIFIVFHKQKARIASKSKYCKQCYVAKDLQDGINYIINKFSCEKYKPIVLGTGDQFVEYISFRYNELSCNFLIPGFKVEGYMQKVLDKCFQISFAQQLGMNVPQSYIYKNNNFNINNKLVHIQFPCIIKPAIHYQNYYRIENRFKIIKCLDINQFKAAKERFEEGKTYLIQEYIEKDNLIVINGCRLNDGKVIVSGALIAEYGGEEGDSSFGYLTEKIPDCIDLNLIKDFVRKIDYYGPFGFDFGIKNNKAYFFEINLRIDATNYLFYKSGGQFILNWINDVTAIKMNNIKCEVKGKHYFMDDIGELHLVASRKMSVILWIKHFFKSKIHKYYNWKDMFPFLTQFLLCILYPFYKKIRRKK